MAATIRLRRGGRRNAPIYRVVAADSRMPRDGRFLEIIGWYRPTEKPGKVSFDIEKTLKWLKLGAEPSDTVRTLFEHTGLADIWKKAEKGEDYSNLVLKDTVTEKAGKVKARKRARMAEAAGAKKEG